MIDVVKSHNFSNWIYTKGNAIEYVYYSGIEAKNPSGAPNIKRIVYKDSDAATLLTVEYTYDADDNVIKEESI